MKRYTISATMRLPMPAEAARIVVGEYVDRTAVEEVAQLLGHDPAEVAAVTITADEVMVYEWESRQARTMALHRHVIR